jgi:hypothetical protein
MKSLELGKQRLRYASVGVIVLLLGIGSASQSLAAKGGKGRGGGATCKILPETDIAVYVGSGTGSSSRLWAEALIDFWKTGSKRPGEAEKLNAAGGMSWGGDPDVDYVTLTLNEFNACSAENFSALKLILMPGGSAYEIQDSLGASGKSKLTDFLDNGGSYVGFCAGGYYASKGYFWKGDDGAPADTCGNQFCRYETAGTFSFDAAAGDFTVHEWNGTSYHSNLLAYGPLAEVLVEGPIEEIAGPWHPDSTPDHPYDSHLITTDDGTMPELRVIYWGGATENYIYTDNAPWGRALAYFSTDSVGNNDLEFPQPGQLWALKTVATDRGGSILISSAHIEASLFHTDSTFADGGMTECQQYNNYTYLVKTMSRELGLSFTSPDYDSSCTNGRVGEVRNTAELFPQGLAYQNAPRIGDGGGSGGGNTGEGNAATGFDGGDLGDFVLSGSAVRPWAADSAVACVGSHAARAGHSRGVDSASSIRVPIPAGTVSITYNYSYPRALDTGDDFHVILDDSQVVREYETGPGTTCAEDTVDVAGATSLTFRCRSGGNGETCTVDHIVFNN